MFPDAEGSGGCARRAAGRCHRADVVRHRRRGRPTPRGHAYAVARSERIGDPVDLAHPDPDGVLRAVARRERSAVRARDAKRRRSAAIDETQVRSVDSLYCVVSSADEDLGCFIDRASAEERQRSTGQQRLLDVIGQTARLEERPVLAIVTPERPVLRGDAGHVPDRRRAPDGGVLLLRARGAGGRVRGRGGQPVPTRAPQ